MSNETNAVNSTMNVEKSKRPRVTFKQIYDISEKIKVYKEEILEKKLNYDQVAKFVSEDLGHPVSPKTIKNCWRAVFPDIKFPSARVPGGSSKKLTRLSGGAAYAKLRWEQEKTQILSEFVITILASLGAQKEVQILQNKLKEAEERYKNATNPKRVSKDG